MIRKRPVPERARRPHATPGKTRRASAAGGPPSGTRIRAALYVRVSTDDQRLDMQLDAGRTRARDRGWELVDVYEDQGVSGARAHRPGLDRLLADARSRRFDVLLVWRADRLFRSVTHIVATLEELGALGIEFVSCTESFDTTTPQGRLLFHIVSAFAQFERDSAIERTRAGMAAARRRGAKIGRPRRRVDVERADELLAEGYSLRAVARELGVRLGTLYRARGRAA